MESHLCILEPMHWYSGKLPGNSSATYLRLRTMSLLPEPCEWHFLLSIFCLSAGRIKLGPQWGRTSLLQRVLQRLKKRKLSKYGLQRYPISITYELRTADSWALPQRIHQNLFLSKISSDAYPQGSLRNTILENTPCPWKIWVMFQDFPYFF